MLEALQVGGFEYDSPKAVERLVRIPEQDGNPVFDRNEWIYEHLK